MIYFIGNHETHEKDVDSLNNFLFSSEIISNLNGIVEQGGLSYINDETNGKNLVGGYKDLKECIDPVSLTDTMIADTITRELEVSDRVGVIAHSSGNIDFNNALSVMAEDGYEVPEGKELGLISIGSPVKYKDLDENLKNVGGTLEGQYNDPLDIVTHPIWLKGVEAGTAVLGGIGAGIGAVKIGIGAGTTILSGSTLPLKIAIAETVGKIGTIGIGGVGVGTIGTLTLGTVGGAGYLSIKKSILLVNT